MDDRELEQLHGCLLTSLCACLWWTGAAGVVPHEQETVTELYQKSTRRPGPQTRRRGLARDAQGRACGGTVGSVGSVSSIVHPVEGQKAACPPTVGRRPEYLRRFRRRA